MYLKSCSTTAEKQPNAHLSCSARGRFLKKDFDTTLPFLSTLFLLHDDYMIYSLPESHQICNNRVERWMADSSNRFHTLNLTPTIVVYAASVYERLRSEYQAPE